jgi:hypothetical protein
VAEFRRIPTVYHAFNMENGIPEKNVKNSATEVIGVKTLLLKA